MKDNSRSADGCRAIDLHDLCDRRHEHPWSNGKHSFLEGRELVRPVDGNIHPHIPLSHQAAVVMESSFLDSNFTPPSHSRHVFLALSNDDAAFPPQTLMCLIMSAIKLTHTVRQPGDA